MSGVKHNKIKLREVNRHLVCRLCRGYYVDATTIAECLHSFCRSCIIKYLEKNSFCPICEVQIHKTKPYLNLRLDKALQDVVYKVVPGLYHDEMKRRRKFYSKHQEQIPVTTPEQCGLEERIIFSPEDSISLSLEYLESDDYESETVSSQSSESGDNPDGLSFPQQLGLMKLKNNEGRSSRRESQDAPEASTFHKRYLRCPAVVNVSHLKKFIRMKHELTDKMQVDIIHKRVPLPDHYTLMDVAYIYTWKRSAPLRFFYQIYQTKRHKLRAPPTIPEVEESTIEAPKKEIPVKDAVDGKLQNGEIPKSPLEMNSKPNKMTDSKSEILSVGKTPPSEIKDTVNKNGVKSVENGKPAAEIKTDSRAKVENPPKNVANGKPQNGEILKLDSVEDTKANKTTDSGKEILSAGKKTPSEIKDAVTNGDKCNPVAEPKPESSAKSETDSVNGGKKERKEEKSVNSKTEELQKVKGDLVSSKCGVPESNNKADCPKSNNKVECPESKKSKVESGSAREVNENQSDRKRLLLNPISGQLESVPSIDGSKGPANGPEEKKDSANSGVKETAKNGQNTAESESQKEPKKPNVNLLKNFRKEKPKESKVEVKSGNGNSLTITTVPKGEKPAEKEIAKVSVEIKAEGKVSEYDFDRISPPRKIIPLQEFSKHTKCSKYLADHREKWLSKQSGTNWMSLQDFRQQVLKENSTEDPSRKYKRKSVPSLYKIGEDGSKKSGRRTPNGKSVTDKAKGKKMSPNIINIQTDNPDKKSEKETEVPGEKSTSPPRPAKTETKGGESDEKMVEALISVAQKQSIEPLLKIPQYSQSPKNSSQSSPPIPKNISSTDISQALQFFKDLRSDLKVLESKKQLSPNSVLEQFSQKSANLEPIQLYQQHIDLIRRLKRQQMATSEADTPQRKQLKLSPTSESKKKLSPTSEQKAKKSPVSEETAQFKSSVDRTLSQIQELWELQTRMVAASNYKNLPTLLQYYNRPPAFCPGSTSPPKSNQQSPKPSNHSPNSGKSPQSLVNPSGSLPLTMSNSESPFFNAHGYSHVINAGLNSEMTYHQMFQNYLNQQKKMNQIRQCPGGANKPVGPPPKPGSKKSEGSPSVAPAQKT